MNDKRLEMLKCLKTLFNECADRNIDTTEIDLTDIEQFCIVDTENFSIYCMRINYYGDTIATTNTIDYTIGIPYEIDDFDDLTEFVTEQIKECEKEK